MRFVFGVPILTGVRIYAFTEEEQYNRFLKKYNFSPEKDERRGEVTKIQDGLLSIYLRSTDISTIIHETLHLAWFILDTHGVLITADNHEVLAYLQEYLFQKISKKLEG